MYPSIINMNRLKMFKIGSSFAERIKKLLRDNNGAITETIKTELLDYYLSVILRSIGSISFCLGVPFNHIAYKNIEKLQSRHDRGVLKGSGDFR